MRGSIERHTPRLAHPNSPQRQTANDVGRCCDNPHGIQTHAILREVFARCTFRVLKCRNVRASSKNHTLVRDLKSSDQVQMLMLSVPHRLLSLALARGYLRDHETLHSVLHGTDRTIKLKEECLHESLFSGLYQRNVNAYLQQVCPINGFPPDLTLYAFRRQSATIIERAMGEQTSQQTMDHGIGTSTYRRYCDRGQDNIDTTNLIVDDGDGYTGEEGAELALHLRRVHYPDLLKEIVASSVQANLQGMPEWQEVHYLLASVQEDPEQYADFQRFLRNFVLGRRLYSNHS